MHDFEDERNALSRNGAEPLAGSGLENEPADDDFVVEDETEGGKK